MAGGLDPAALRRVSVVCGLLVAAIGFLVLLGWALDSETLKRVAPSLAAMKFNTAVALIAAGAAVVLLRDDGGGRAKVAGRLLGLAIALFGAVVCAEYLFGGVGIDELPFSDPGATYPGRPSPHTAVTFVVLGLALLTTDLQGRRRWLNPALVVAFCVAALFATVGYSFGVRYLHGVTGAEGIAVGTVAALLLLAAALFCLRPEPGPAAIVIGEDAGARMARALAPVGVLGPLVFGLVLFGAYQAGWVGLRVGLSLSTIAAVIGLTAVVLVTATRLRRADARLRRMAAIIGSSADAVVSLDQRREITSWNPSAERLLGYTAEEAIGRPVVDLVPPDLLGEFEERMSALADGRPITGWETERQAKDGSRVEVELTVSPLRDSLGRVGGATAILRDIRERHEAERHFQSLLDAAPDAMVIVDAAGKIELVNQQAERSFGYRRQELVGHSVELLVPEHVWNSHVRHREKFAAAPETGPMGLGRKLTARRRDGSEFPVEVSLSPVQRPDGPVVIAAVRDLTRRRETERALARSEELFRRSFEDSGVGMALVGVRGGRPGKLFKANEAVAAISGYPAAQLPQIPPTSLVHPSELPAALEELEALLRGDVAVARRELRLLAAGGEQVWVSVTGSIVREADGAPAYLVAQVLDISERKHFEGQLQYLADHDALTGLFNRRRFEEELEREVAVADRFESGGAVLVLDLDHFKLVNDTLGHAAGDELIAAAGQVLRERLRGSDVLGRMGGDEFAVILPQVTPEQAGEVAATLLTGIRDDRRVSRSTDRSRVTASLGIATFGAGAPKVDPQELLAEADIAMYDAKDAGRDRVVVFDPRSPRHERTRERLDWMERIERALEEDRFVLHAQPILSLDGDRSHRFELLLRMVGDGGDLIPPGAFLYLAERSDLAQRIDRWVVRRAVEMLAEQERLGRDVRFEVNLSGGSIGDEALGDHIAATVSEAEIDPRRLVFEVTETAAIVNVGRAKEFAQRMRELGCGFALDDFGAGFASFYYLKHLSFDLLKIDGEFIRNLPSSRTDQLVVKSVVDIARGLGKRTVAECVGDRQTVDLLRRYGVDYAQGFFVGMPGPLEDAFARTGSDTLAR